MDGSPSMVVRSPSDAGRNLDAWQAGGHQEGDDVNDRGGEITLSGDPRARGTAYGEACQGPITSAIERWCEELARRGSRGQAPGRRVNDPAAILRAAVTRVTAAPHLDRWAPGLTEEIAGIAEGSGQDPQLIWALTLMDEVWMLVDRDHPGPVLGCSTVGAVPVSAPPLLGQTMDLPACHAAFPTLLHIEPYDGPAQHVLTFAGSVGLCGWNDAGLAVCCNSLAALPGRTDGLPVAGTVRAVLACEDLEEAWAIVRDASHACPQHIAVGGPGGLRGFQVSASGVVEHAVTPGGTYAHTNHPVRDTGANDATVNADQTDSIARLSYLQAAAPRDLSAMVTSLDDRSVPISCGPTGRADDSISAVTFAAELSAPPVAHYRVGPPGIPWRTTRADQT